MQTSRNEGIPTYLVAEALVAYRRVKMKAGTTTTPPEVEYADAGELCIGVTLGNQSTVGGTIAVQGLNDSGTFLITASAGIAEGADLYGTNDGKVDDTGTGTPQFKARMAASGNGHVIECVISPYVATTAATVSIADAGSHTTETDLEGATQELYLQQRSVLKRINIPLMSFVDIAGTQLTTFADGASDQPGLELTGNEALSIRWNNHAAPLAVCSQFQVPNDADVTANMTLKFLASKTGNTLADAVTFTVTAFNQVVGALYDADSNFGGASGAMTGDIAAKTVQTVSLTLSAANLAAVGSNVTVTLKPTAGTLGTDDLLLHAVWVEYKGKLVAS